MRSGDVSKASPKTKSLAAEITFQALRPVVHDHVDIENAGASVEDIEAIDRDPTGDDA